VQLNALKMSASDGTDILILDGGYEIRSFSPSPNQTGKCWKVILSNNYNYELLIIPDVYFLFDEKK